MEVPPPKKIKNRATVSPSNPTSGYVSKGDKKRISKRHVHPHVHRIINSSQDLETVRVSVQRWLTTRYTHNNRLLNHEKEGRPAVCNSVDGP